MEVEAGAVGTRRSPQLWGYVPDFDTAAAWASARANRVLFAGITQVRYYPDAAGELHTYPGAAPVPAWTRDQGLPVVPLLANQIAGKWDRELIGYLLTDQTRREHHVRRIVTCVCTGEHPGVELDYEFLATPLRDAFSAFVASLAAALHEAGKTLAVAVHAKTSEPGDAAGSGAQDWGRIGAVADRIAVMTYDCDPARPGPIAPLAWTREVLAHAASWIAPAKILQGIPLYGYRWVEGSPPSYLTYREFLHLAHRSGSTPQRDAADRYLVLEGSEAGIPMRAWLPDAETVTALASIGRELGVAGYSVWRLGGEQTTTLAGLHRTATP